MICIPTYPSDGFLWKVTGNGLKQESYILGTMHGDGLKHSLKDISLKSARIEDIVDEVDMVVTEVSDDFQDSAVVSDCRKAFAMVMAYEGDNSASAMPRNNSYSDLYKDRKKYDRTDSYMIDTLHIDGYQSRKPMYWALRIVGVQMPEDKSEEHSLDRCVTTIARQKLNLNNSY